LKQEEWREWHEMVKREIKRQFPKAELEKPYYFGEKMPWGQLESYQVDASLKINGKLCIFEVETYYRQDKIIRFIMFSNYVGADSLIIIFSNQRDVWDGETRVKATNYLGEIVNSLLNKPVKVTALFANSASELKPKLKNLAKKF
jgi:hypothetical protein